MLIGCVQKRVTKTVKGLEDILAGEAEGIGTVLPGEQEAKGTPHRSVQQPERRL